MDKIRQTAMFAIGRAVFFGGFAISIVMLAFAFDFLLAFRAGAILTLAMATILLWFAQTARNRRPEQSEVWLLLPNDDQPRDEATRRLFVQVMQDVYLFYALRAFAIAISMLAISVMLSLSGVKIGLT